MDKPLAQRGHENTSNRVHDDKYEHHDDPVCPRQRVRRTASTSTTGYHWRVRASTAAIAIAAVVIRVAADKRIRIAADAGLRKVDFELFLVIVFGDAGVDFGRVERLTFLPRRNPIVAAVQLQTGAVAATDVRDHCVVFDTGPFEKLK